MRTIFVTDARFDDSLAWAQLVRQSKEGAEIHVVISDVHDTDGAARLLLGIQEEMESKGLSAKIGKLSFHVGDVRTSPLQHEEIFQVASNIKTPSFSVGLEVTTADSVFCFAPYSSALAFAKAREVCISMGHNLNSSGLTLTDLDQFEHLVTMNNLESYPKGKEGGRFTLEEVRYITSQVSLLEACIPFGLNDSINFITRQLIKFANGSKGGKAHPCSLSADVISGFMKQDREALIPYAKEVFECFTGSPLIIDASGALVNPSNTYLDRVMDQILHGLHIQVSDLQHLLVYCDSSCSRARGSFVLVGSELRFVTSADGKVSCVTNLLRETLWTKACQVFTRSPCISPSMHVAA